MNDKDILYEVAKLAQFNACESIWWRINADRSSEATGLRVLVDCSDVFEWGTADCEEVSVENLAVLQQAVADMRRATGSEYDGQSKAFLLFCARVRQQRPQGAYYKCLTGRTDEITVKIRDLFDACGPEREVDILNPHKQPVAAR